MYADRPLITAHRGKLAGSNHYVPESMPPTSSRVRSHVPNVMHTVMTGTMDAALLLEPCLLWGT